MDISILISTRNNARRLKETLLHISRCRIPRGILWEVVVVNHNSQDHTEQVAREMQMVLPLKYAVETREGQGHARNSTLSTSSGDLLILTDDDVKPDPGWMEAYWAAYLANPTGRFWGGPIESEFEDGEPNWELVRLGPTSIKGLDLGGSERNLKKNDILLTGANWACPSIPLKGAGGFDSELGLNTAVGSSEETDLMERLMKSGIEAWYLPLAKLRHIVPMSKVSLRHLGNRRRAYGRFEARNVSRSHTRLVPLLGVPPWVVRKFLEASAAWIFARISGRSGFSEYLEAQEMLGVADALRTARKRTERAFVQNP